MKYFKDHFRMNYENKTTISMTMRLCTVSCYLLAGMFFYRFMLDLNVSVAFAVLTFAFLGDFSFYWLMQFILTCSKIDDKYNRLVKQIFKVK